MPRTVHYLLVALLLVVVLYVARQLVAREFDGQYRSFGISQTLAEARADGTLLATYRAVPSDRAEAVPAVEAVYAARPHKKVLGALLWTTYVEADAARVVARLSESDGHFRLAFNDGAGVRIQPDGSVERGPFDDGTTSASDLVQCCFAVRAAPPERFWLERRGERLIEFVREDG